jgi:hypothetical protein
LEVPNRTILRLDVEKDHSNFVFDGDILVKKDWNNVAHMVSDLLTLGVCAHGEVLLHLAQLIDITLKLIQKLRLF